MKELDVVQKILWEQGDPIGVNNEPRAYGEYDSYAPRIVSIVVNGGTDHDVAEYLGVVERSSMGLQGSPLDHRLTIANAVRQALLA